MDSRLSIFVIAGEPSGDRLGGALMAGLKSLRPDCRFAGIGGPEMAAQGLESLFAMEELSVMGLAEVLPRLRHLLRRRDEAIAACLAMQPDALITIDSPDFCLRVAKGVRAAAAIPTIHYVAPTVWAWRPKRAIKMARHIDHVLALFPFEPPYMEAAGMSCDFVGHPVVAEPVASETDAALFRQETGLGSAPVLMVLPGSRQGEVQRLAPIFGQTLERVCRSRRDLRILIPAAAPVVDLVRDLSAGWPGDPVVLDPRDLQAEDWAHWKRAAFRAADFALAASGTVSLELAAADTPMIIAYDMNWLTRQMLKRLLRVDTVTLVNLVSGRRAVPEFLGDACRAEKIAPALLTLLLDQPSQADQRAAFALTLSKLGQGDEAPGLRAARSVLAQITR